MEKKGLSDVVTVGLIILLAITAIIILWGFVRSSLESTGENINVESLQLSASIEEVIITDELNAEVLIKNNGGRDIPDAKLIISDNTKSQTFATGPIPALETKKYLIPLEATPEKVELYPVLNAGGETGSAIASISQEKNADKFERKFVNLVGWWQFENNFEDSSGNGHHGTPMGGVTADQPSVNEGLGKSALFDGANHYITLSTSTTPDINIQDFRSGDRTVAVWINTRANSVSSTQAIFSLAGTNYYFGRLNLGNIHSNYASVDSLGGSTNRPVPSLQVILEDVWQHLAYVIDVTGDTGVSGSQVEVRHYLNGVFIDKRIDSDPNNDYSLSGGHATINSFNAYIGYLSDGSPNNKYSGYLDDVRIYNRALSSTEVQAIYESTK